jgi:hypothetical protein
MHLGIISLADRVVHNIKSEPIKQEILKELYTLYNVKIIEKHDHKLDATNQQYVKTNPHLVSLRSNGNRYILYLTKYNDIEIIYLIDAKIHPTYTTPRMIILKGLFHKELYNNTIIYCEMVKTSTGWLCLFNDIIVYKGQHLATVILPDRLKIMYNLLETEYTRDKMMDICNYKIKTYFQLCDESIEELMKISSEVNYTSRGIYFWPYNLKYKPKLYNFDENKIRTVVRKIKDDNRFKRLEVEPIIDVVNVVNITCNTNVNTCNTNVNTYNTNVNTCLDCNTLLLYLSKSSEPDIYNLYENQNILTSKKIGIALIPNLTTSKMIRNAFKNTNITSTIKVKCNFNAKFNKWYPIEIL